MTSRWIGIVQRTSWIGIVLVACGASQPGVGDDASVREDAGYPHDAYEPCMAVSASERIAHSRTEGPANHGIESVGCKWLPPTVSLGGSAAFFDRFNPLVAFTDIGFMERWASWASFNDVEHLTGAVPRRVLQSVCLAPHETNDCEWEIEASITESIRTAPAQSVADFQFECPADTMLVSGSCFRLVRDSPDLGIGGTAIARHGFVEPFRRWSCVVANASVAAAEYRLAAVCLKPFIQARCGGCSTVGDLIELVATTTELNVGTNRVQATCPEGTRLILGNCMIDAPVSEMSRLTMFGTGYTGDVSPDNTWECAWNNRDGIYGSATTYALCLH